MNSVSMCVQRYQGEELPPGCRTSVTFRRLRRPDQMESDAIWAANSTTKRSNIDGRFFFRVIPMDFRV